MAITDEHFLDNRFSRREKADERAFDRQTRREQESLPLVGQLMREGTLIYYINVRSATGTLTGKTKEFPTETAAIDYLLRNNYV